MTFSDFVPVDVVIAILKAHGHEASLEGPYLMVHPKEPGPGPIVEKVMVQGVGRRIVHSIARKTGVPVREFWNPSAAKRPSWLPGRP